MPKNLLLILLTGSLFFASCKSTRYIYSPSPPNSPSFEKKGDSKLAAYYSGSGSRGTVRTKNNGYDIQGAYAITDNWAITGSYFSRKESDSYVITPMNSWSNIYDSTVVDYKRRLAELGGGYFTSLNKDRTIWFNCYTGIGFGRFSFIDNKADSVSSYSRFHKSNIIKWFLQPGFTIYGGKYFRLLLLGRMSIVNYSNISTSYTTKELENFKLNKIPKSSLVFIEPTTSVQFIIPGCEWLSAEAGATLSTDAFLAIGPRARNFGAYVGLSFDVLNIKKK
jgi:hypothetical protein